MSTSLSDCLRELRRLRNAVEQQERTISSHERTIGRLRSLVLQTGLRVEILEGWAENGPTERRFRRSFSPVIGPGLIAMRQRESRQRREKNKEALKNLQLHEFSIEKLSCYEEEQRKQREGKNLNSKLKNFI